MIEGLTRRQARKVIEVVGSAGQPPEWGFQFFSAGLDPYLKVLEEDYLKSLVREGGSSFKMVVGTYGGGKTHFLYSVRELAWKHGFLVSYCPLSPNDSPFYKLEKVYRAVVANLMRPLTPDELLAGSEKGMVPFLKAVHQDVIEGLQADQVPDEARAERLHAIAADATRDLENPNFGRAVRAALDALTDDRRETFEEAVRYLQVDGYDRAIHRELGILHAVERGQAFSMLRSLVAFIRALNYNGLVILFDEVEQVGAMLSKQKEMMLSNLREMVDQCGSASFANVMVFYAIPNEHFLTEGRSPAYEALRQRIQTVFDYTNPTGVKIRLDRLGRDPRALMIEIGTRLASVYETAYDVEFPLERKGQVVSVLADAVKERAFGDIGYKRLFVQALVRALHALRLGRDVEVDGEFAARMLEGPAGEATLEGPDD